MDKTKHNISFRYLSVVMMLMIWAGITLSVSAQNYALTFDGSGDYVNYGNPAGLQIAGDQTIELWIYPTALDARRNPIAKAYAGEGTMTLETNGTVNYFYGTGGGNNNPYQSFNSGTSVAANTWTHIAIVRDLTNMKLYWYVNGVLTNSTNASYGYAQSGSLNFYVGRGYVSDFKGMIDEVRVWNVARSQYEINTYKNVELTGSETGLAAYWKFNEGFGNITYDNSSGGNDGTMNGNASFVLSGAPVYQASPGNEPFEPIPPTGLPYNIVLAELTINGEEIPQGTQIGVFDGDLCVGSAFYEGEPNQNLVAWQADPDQNLAGFTPGNVMTFKYHATWYSQIRNFDATSDFSQGDGTFGDGTYSVVNLSATTSLVPDFAISDTLLNFNTVIMNESKTLSVVIENNGTAILHMTSFANSVSHFELSKSSAFIPAGETDTLFITFTPSAVTTYEDGLVLESDDPDVSYLEIPLYGTGLPQPTPQITINPTHLDFGGIAMNTSKSLKLNIFNAGNGDLVINNISSSDGNFSTFGATSFTLGQGENRNVAVIFSPTAKGGYTTNLTIEANSGNRIIPATGVASDGYFTSVNPTGKPYSIILEDVSVDGFRPEVGDEVAVFDNGLCVGNGIARPGGNSLLLDGSGDYLINDNSTEFDLQLLTISAWVYSSNFSQNGFIFEKGPVNTQYSLFFEGSNLNFRTYPSGGSGYDNFYNNSASLGIDNNKWHFITATYDGNSKRIYVDGQLKATQSYNKTLRTGREGQIIGAYGGTGSHSYYFNGNIDEVRVWNYARTPFQIQEDMFRSLSGSEQGLIGYWNFDNGNHNNLVAGSTQSYLSGNASLGGTPPPNLFSATLITAWEKDDALGLPGFTPGNPMSFKVWTEVYDNQVELEGTPQYIVGDGSFGLGQFTSLTLEATSGLAPDIVVPIDNLYVGQVTVGESVVNNIKIYNTGNAPLHVAISETSDAFSVGTSEAVIPEMDSLTFEVTFAPTVAGGYSTDLLIECNDPDEQKNYISIEGFALPAGSPDINTSVDHIGFSNVEIDAQKTISFYVINTGTSSLNVTGIQSNNDVFTVTPTSFTLQNTNDVKEVFVTFQPWEKGYFSGALTISSNAADIQVDLSGVGIENELNVVAETGQPYSIIIESTNIDDLIEPGDELAVFDGALCVGLANTAALMNGEQLTITAWEKDDENGLPGFTPGNPMSFKIYTEINGIPSIFDATPTYIVGTGNFGSGQFSVVQLEFALPAISVDPDEIFVALNEPDSTEKTITITNNGTGNLYFRPYTGEDPLGKSVSLDGSNDYVALGNLSPGSQWTVEAWVKPSSLPGGRHTIMGGFNSCLDWGIVMSNGAYGIGINPPGSCSQTVSSATEGQAETGTWAHVAATCDGTTARLYVNGEFITSAPVSGNYVGYGNDVRIGGEACCSGNNFPGLIDEVRLWNVVRSESEIRSNMPTNLTGNEAGLKGYWNFEDGTATDLTGNGFNGTLINEAEITAPGSPGSGNWITLPEGFQTLAAGASMDLDFMTHSEGLNDGLYNGTIILDNNTTDMSGLSIPVTLNVTGNPQIEPSPLVVDFGEVIVNTSSEETLSLKNIGTQDLIIDEISLQSAGAGNFSVDLGALSFPLTIAPGDETEISPGFAPTMQGPDSDTLWIISNASNADTLKVALTGEGITPPEIAVSGTSFSYTFACNDIYSDSIKIFNLGQENLDFDISGSAGWISGSPAQGTVAGGDSLTMMVSISTLDLFAGTHQGQLLINSNDPGQPVVAVDYFLTVTGEPAILANDFLDLGSGNVGETEVGELLIANSGCDTLEITSVNVESQQPVFNIQNPEFTVPPGEASTLYVEFSPEIAQQYSGIINIQSNDPANPSLPVVVSAVGVEPPEMTVSPLSISSVLQSGDSETQSFTVQNTGGEVLDFSTEVNSINPNLLSLDGSGDYINVVNNAMLNPGSALTMEAWVNLTVTTNAFIMGKENASEGKYRLWIDENQKVEFKLNNQHTLVSQSSVPAGTWVHIAATFNGTDMKIFIDGTPDAEATFAPFTITPTTDNLRIGRSYQFAFLNGKLDEIRLWNIARNQLEIQSAMHQSLTGSEPELLLYFPFINSSGNIVTDASSHSNNGILYGNPVRQASDVHFNDYLALSNATGSLSGGQSQDVDLDLNTGNFFAGSYQRNITVSGNDENNPTDVVSVSLTIEGTGMIAANPSQLQFDDTFTGLSDTLELIIENTGALAAGITDISFSSSAFYKVNDVSKIFPFSQKVLIVVFEPSAIQSYNEMLTISFTDADVPQLQIPLTGLGVTPPVPEFTPDVAQFGDVVVNNSGTVSVSLSNSGSSDLEVYSYSFSDENLFSTNLVLPQTIGFTQSVPFDVVFTPANYNPVNAEMIFSTNIGTMSFALSGIGVPPDHDLAVTQVISPESGCGLSDAEPLTVTIHNFGLLDQSGFDVGYSLNGAASVVETIAGTLLSGEQTDYTFNQALDLSATGDYNLEIFTLLPNDENTGNDSLSYDLTNSPSVGEFTNMTPTDSSFGVVEPVSFTWTTVPNATMYDLYIWRTSQTKPINPTVEGITGTSYTYYDYLNKNYLYNWQMVGRNSCSESESEVRVFSFNVFSDLTVSSIMLPDTGYSGENAEISFSIKNIGTGGTGLIPWKDRVYISPDPVFDEATATLVSTTNNVSGLSAGQSYTKTVNFDLPDYLEGDQYVIVKTDINNKIQETNENNNLLTSGSTMLVILPPYPDLAVSSVQSMRGSIVPGETLSVGWSVQNVGDAPAIGGWSQRVALIAGTKRQILGYAQYTDTLPTGGIIAQTSSFNVPAYPGMEGEVYIEVLLTPYSQLVEKPNGETNNLALSDESFTLEKVLTVSIPQTSIDENASNPLNCMVYRSGDRSAPLQITFAASDPARISVPVSVTIPTSQSGISFTLAAIDNLQIEGDFDVDILANADGYSQSISTITVLDDEAPTLTMSLNLDEVTEGDKFNLTVTRDLVTELPIVVDLYSGQSSQIDLQDTLVIEANQASATIEVDVIDDMTPELNMNVIINASLAGYIPGMDTIKIIDNDVPQVELTITPDTVSEAGGPYAAWGKLTRLEPGDDPIVVLLSALPPGQIFFPAQVTIPPGNPEQQFNIGVIDNGLLDGDRNVEITGAILISSCGCGAPEESGGTTSDMIHIVDIDGPSLAVESNPFVVPENKTNAGILTITRNTQGGDAITVNIQHNKPDEITIASTAVIPEGMDSVEVPFSSLDDGIEDGDQIVSISVSSSGYSSGNCWVMVSDRNLPDFVAGGLELSQNDALIFDDISASFYVSNNGQALAAPGAVVNIYKSTNTTIDNNDELLYTETIDTPLAIGDSIQISTSFTLDDQIGDFYILGVVNKDADLNELIGINNITDPEPLSVTPDYISTAFVDGDVFNGSTAITIMGTTETVNRSPATFKDVDVYIVVNGVRRVLTATSDDKGEFSVDFFPLNGEAGEYYVGACYPGQGLNEAQDNFTLLGARRTTAGYIKWDLWLNQTQNKFLEIKNFSPVDLNNVQVEVLSAPPGCVVNFSPIPNLPGNSYASIPYSVQGLEVTQGSMYEEVKLRLTSNEGTKFNFSAWFYCQATKGNLKLEPVSVSSTMVQNQINYVEFTVRNNGLDSTGLISISLPELNWMSLANPDTISSLDPNETAVVTLKLTPGDDLQLNNPITGQLVLTGVNANSVALPFSFEPISTETGDLLVDVVDEYTYNTPEAPHLDSAMVVLKHPYTGQIIAQGLTDANGHFLAEDVNEGYYTLTVTAQRHASYQDNIYIEKGMVNNELVFIAFQAISYTWDVVPTMIEDQYEITLIVEFETNVPAPVVIMNMPDTMPQLSQGEVFPFLITLTNQGLITAQDVEIEFPEDDEYMFTANVDQVDILPQTAIQIPCIMELRPPGSSPGRSQNCFDYTICSYKFECGPDDQLRLVQDDIYYQGRTCVGSGGPGGGGGFLWWGGGGGGPGGPGGGTGPIYEPQTSTTPITTSNTGCDPCLAEFLNALWGCSPIPNIGIGFSGKLNNNAKGGASAALGLLKFGKDLWGKITCAWDIGWSIGCKINQLIGNTNPLNGRTPDELIQAQEDLFMVDKGFTAIENTMIETYRDESFIEKQDFGLFNDSINSNLEGQQAISEQRQNELLDIFSESDLTALEINTFINHWNTTMEAWGNGIYSPTPEYPQIIDTLALHEFSLEFDSAINHMNQRGFPSLDSLYNWAHNIVESYTEESSDAVCATVTVQFSQTLTMTREAFEGTLAIFNGNETDPMENIQLDLEVRDEDGNLKNDLFQINTVSLDGITGINGSGIIDALQTGTAVIQFISEPGAAPEVPKQYSFGGSFSYLDPFTGEVVDNELFPVTLTVNPSPDLYIDYFMQRDIYGDDALTEPIEPMIPAELAVMIDNRGAGDAYSVNIESAQPEIIENEKGLLIDFNIVGSSLSGHPVQLGLLDVDFGDIPAGDIKVGQWWFTSTLLGHFISYEVSINHLDSYGNPDLSLVSAVDIHELIHGVSVYGAFNDSIGDFLVNDIPDVDDLPDAIYYSNGIVASVAQAADAYTDAPLTLNDTVAELTVTPSDDGWNYTKVDDPGNGLYRIVSITRDDGQVIPKRNVWLTYSTIPDGGEPIYENKLHFVDTFAEVASSTYTIVFEPIDQDVPQVVAINGIPDTPIDYSLENVEVVFSEPIEPSTFTWEDMTLKNQAGPNLMDSLVMISQVNDSTFDVDISDKTGPNGYYTLVVQAAGVADLVGNFGKDGVQVGWLQSIATPAIDYFFGLPEDAGEPIDTLLVLFNMPINTSTFTTDQLELKDADGNVIPSASLEITPESFNDVLFKISGLEALTTGNGTYELTFKLTEIQGENGQAGIQDQSVEWGVCQIPLPIVDAGGDASICTGDTYQLNGSVENGSSYLWTTGGTGTFDDPATLNAVYSPSQQDYNNGSVELTLTAQPLNDCAQDASSSLTLSISNLVAGDAGEDALICEGSTHQFFGVVTNASDFTWTSDGDGSFSNPKILTPVYTPGAQDVENGSVEIMLVVQPMAPCILADTSAATLEIQQAPSVYSGEDMTICENEYISLQGTAENYSAITWLSYGDGTFSGQNTLSPVYRPGSDDINNGAVNFITIANPLDPCFLPAFSSVSVKIDKQPFAFAGDDATVCENQEFQLDGSVLFALLLNWTTSGDGTFSNLFITNPVYTPGPQDLLNGFVELTLTAASSNSCSEPGVSSMMLSFQKLPEADAGADATICENQVWQLSGTVQNTDSFIWQSNGDGQFDDPQSLSATYQPGPDDAINGTVTLTLSALPEAPCVSGDMSSLTLTVEPLPAADAGNDATICETDSYQLSGTVDNSASYEWQTSGDGSFDDMNDLNTVYAPGSGDIASGSVTISLVAQPTAPCETEVSSSLILAISGQASADAGNDVTICEDGTVQLSGSVNNESAFVWTSSGDGTFDDPGILSAVYTPGPSDVANGSAQLTLTAQSMEPCQQDAASEVMVYVQQLPSANAGMDGSVCHNGSYQLSATVEHAGDLTWSSAGDGTFDDPAAANAMYFPGQADIDAGEVQLTLKALPSAPCSAQAEDVLILSVFHCQDINLTDGWSGISSWVEPMDTDPDTIFNKVKDDLVILQSQTGMYWPGQNINTIGQWNYLEGYSIKMNAVANLSLQGSRNSISMLELNNGWTMMPVLSECTVNAADLFSGTDLTIVKEIAGWKVYWPALGINNLVNLESGKAYYVMMNSQGSVAFPDCTPESTGEPEYSGKSFFDRIGTVPWNTFTTTPNTHIIGIPEDAVGESLLKTGDLIGAFDRQGNCYGIAEWNESNASITVFGDDPVTSEKDGFVEGEPLLLKAFIRTTEKEYELMVVYDDELPQSDGLFHSNGLSMIEDLKVGATGIYEGSASDALIYPNPASNMLFIDFDVAGDVSAVIYDVQGHEVIETRLTELRNQVDISGLRNGVYLVKLEGNDLLKIERIIKK